jgi:hypothetical protein
MDWKFPIGLDMHESVPYLYVSTGTGPYNPNIDPITVSEWQWIANYEVTALTALGKPGVWTHGFYDGWNPSYLLWQTNNRNAIGRFYETFGNSLPHTMTRTWADRRPRCSGTGPTRPGGNGLVAAQQRELRSDGRAALAVPLCAEPDARAGAVLGKSNNSLERGRTTAPYAYHLPVDQRARRTWRTC